MRALGNLRKTLRGLAERVEVLPAVGGAIEDLDRPDIEERVDHALNSEERVFEIVFEKTEGAGRPPLYRPTPPVGRGQNHFFRYFLDGSFRSYFLGTILEHERESPVQFAQVGGCVLRREDDGTVRRQAAETRPLLMVALELLSESVRKWLEEVCAQNGMALLDIKQEDEVSRIMSDVDLRNKAAGKVRWAMHKLETELIEQLLPLLSDNCWLIADGSLLFEPTLTVLRGREGIPPVIGVAKNFRKDPQFVSGKGPRAERFSIYKLLADLESEHRTAAFSARGRRVVFWYVRLREQKQLDYPLMGVLKVELVNPSQEPVDSGLIDKISSALVAERTVSPHGQDRRWHAHLYPIFLAECAVKEGLLSRQVVQQYLKWR